MSKVDDGVLDPVADEFVEQDCSRNCLARNGGWRRRHEQH